MDWKQEFNKEFVRDDGLLDIDKYDYDRVIAFIEKVIEYDRNKTKA